MNKIAFDMDGVLLPDYNIIPNLTQSDFYGETVYAKPLINPDYDFDVVTARDEKWRSITETWLKQMSTYPKNVFLKDTGSNESPAEYKFRIAQQEGYTVFVESDWAVCVEMNQLIEKNNSNLHVIHFDSWINSQLKGLL
jgi:hypothetical protein